MDRKCWPSDDRTRVPCRKRWRAIHAQPSQASSRRRRPRGRARWRFGGAWLTAGLAAAIIASVALTAGLADAATLLTPSRSTTITITPDNNWLLVVNRETNSLSIIGVRDAQGQDTALKLAEVTVGIEPRCVALHPNVHEAYVTNGISGTVSVIDLASLRVAAEIPVGPEPRGCALTPNGTWLLVANHTEGSVGVVDTAARQYLGALPLGPTVNPMAIAVSNDGDADEADETVFVTQFFAELIPGGPGEGRDTGKRGIVHALPLATLVPTRITLSPFSNVGFTSNRANFCPQFNPNIHPPHVTNPIFCPNAAITDPNNPVIAQAPQGAFPNQLASALIRGTRLWLPNIGAGPEPVERFDTNVQALVHVVDTGALTEAAGEHVNLNVEIATEPTPADPASLVRLFGNDLVAIDADPTGTVFLIVSRGGNYVMRATRGANGRLTLGAPNVIRWQTGNLPDGVVISYDGRRAYVNNEANVSVTAINLETNSVITLDIPSGEPPAPGTFEHAVLVGKVAFFTALGLPDNGLFDLPIRELVPLHFRGKQSNNAWSSCGSCHPDGLADGVTWFFGTGPRQTIPLDGMFAKDNPDDQRLLNWSAVRGSNHDFNNNSRATQGGCGFASDAFAPGQCLAQGPMTPANPAVYDHGITQGGSDALDVQTLWIFAAVRPLRQPPPSDAAAFDRGREVFAANCASCHGGAKWSKSQIFHRDNPAAVGQGGAPLDPGVLNRANEFRSFTCNALTFNYLEGVGTFDVNNPLEIRDITAITALGADGVNPPSLLSGNYHAPYLHRGQAQTLAEVFPRHFLPASGKTIRDTLADQGVSAEDLLAFLKSIDGSTDHLRSEGDDFRDALRLQGTCPPPPVQ